MVAASEKLESSEDIPGDVVNSWENWRQETTCPACQSKAFFLRNKREKLRIQCVNCGPLFFQTKKGQAMLEARLASGDDSEISEEHSEAEEQLESELLPEKVPEGSEKPQGKKRGLYCSLMFITGGLGFIAWRLKRTAEQASS